MYVAAKAAAKGPRPSSRIVILRILVLLFIIFMTFLSLCKRPHYRHESGRVFVSSHWLPFETRNSRTGAGSCLPYAPSNRDGHGGMTRAPVLHLLGPEARALPGVTIAQAIMTLPFNTSSWEQASAAIV